MDDLATYFDGVYAVNLRRRPERYEAFARRIEEAGWPFSVPVRVEAIDGQLVNPPQWFNQGGGAWGVYRSHMGIIERAINEQLRKILILEDDAVPIANFTERARAFLAMLPADAELVYLGGQMNHYPMDEHPPEAINAEVVRPWSCNRLHAFALSAPGMQKAYRHLASHQWQRGHHIDHHLERLSRSGGIKTYAPTTWLFGQADGKSDICGRDLPVRFFDKGVKLPTVLVVLGPYRGGTSAVAGAIHHMGISMGNQFFSGGRGASPKGCFEAKRLFDICLACYPEPSFRSTITFQHRVKLLRSWLQGRRNEQAVIGAKHPKLCLMVPEIAQAWPGCKFVVVHRDIKDSIASLTTLGWWRPAQKPEALIHRLVDTRDQAIPNIPADRVLRVDYADMLSNPQLSLEAIAQFAAVEPLPEQYRLACEHVDPKLQHYTGG